MTCSRFIPDAEMASNDCFRCGKLESDHNMSYISKLVNLSTVTHVRHPNDVPCVPHYAIIVYAQQSVFIEGDERSRTNPGHGYPAHTDTYDVFKHYTTTNKDQWLQLIQAIMIDDEVKTKFVAFHVGKVAKVKTRVEVEIE